MEEVILWAISLSTDSAMIQARDYVAHQHGDGQACSEGRIGRGLLGHTWVRSLTRAALR